MNIQIGGVRIGGVRVGCADVLRARGSGPEAVAFALECSRVISISVPARAGGVAARGGAGPGGADRRGGARRAARWPAQRGPLSIASAAATDAGAGSRDPGTALVACPPARRPCVLLPLPSPPPRRSLVACLSLRLVPRPPPRAFHATRDAPRVTNCCPLRWMRSAGRRIEVRFCSPSATGPPGVVEERGHFLFGDVASSRWARAFSHGMGDKGSARPGSRKDKRCRQWAICRASHAPRGSELQ
ncbi:Protein of unknown function [Gryllus bimaculatus]|nr:Protein of unknown function [Gryllus bimaculatus]